MTKLLRRGETALPPSHQLWGDLLFLRRNAAFSAVPRQLVTGRFDHWGSRVSVGLQARPCLGDNPRTRSCEH